MWFVTGKNLNPIAKAADLPSFPQVVHPILQAGPRLADLLIKSFETLDSLRALTQSFEEAHAAYNGLETQSSSLLGILF